MASLAEIRAALAAQQNKGKNQGQRTSGSGGDNASYPFWNTPVNQSATLRFLPDSDPDNMFFWRERQVIRLPFEGIVGGDYPTNDKVEVTVPCMDMFGETCPIIVATRPLWKGTDAEKALARVYWKRKSFIYQGFVVDSPFDEENAPENPIRRFVLGPSIHDIVKEALADPEMEDMPTDYIGGTDFRVSKTQKGDYANYANSKFMRKPRSLTETEMSAIEQHKLWDLKQFMGAKPDADGVAAIKALFEASFAGEPYDWESFNGHFKPWVNNRGGSNGGDRTSSAATTTTTDRAAPARTAPAAQAVTESAEADEAPVEKAASNPQDILAKIRARSGK